MKFLTFSTLTFLLFFSVSIFAQNEKTIEADWQTFQPKGEEFTVTTPIPLKSFVPDKNVNSRQFTASFNGRFLFISSDTLSKPFHYKKIQELLKSTQFKSQKAKDASLEIEKITIDYSDDFFHDLWIFKTKSRIYIFHTASEIENDEIILKFLKSVKIDRKLIGENENTELEFSEPIGISEGGTGSRNSGFAIDANTPSNSESLRSIDSNNSSLKIISKPRANYTDIARFFDVQGTVRLRVTFLSTGEIGAVEVVKKLPFGLTANAIEAARKMRFEPMRRDRSAINVAKLVEYSFTIY